MLRSQVARPGFGQEQTVANYCSLASHVPRRGEVVFGSTRCKAAAVTVKRKVV